MIYPSLFARKERDVNMFDLKKMKRLALATGVASAALAAAPAHAALVNVIPGNYFTLGWGGIEGVLRAGSPWGPGSTPSDPLKVVDGNFMPEGTQWNNGSFWWDQDSSVNPVQEVVLTIYLTQSFNFEKFVMQADDNDGYYMEYWDGAAWQLGWDFGTQPSFGLVTRPDALVSITTDTLRLRAYGGDNYFAISEFQGFVNTGVPEPAAWALMLGGFGMVGGALRRRAKVSYAA